MLIGIIVAIIQNFESSNFESGHFGSMAILAQAVLAQDILAQAMLTQAILDPWPFWLAVLAQAMHKSKEDLLFKGGGCTCTYIFFLFFV